MTLESHVTNILHNAAAGRLRDQQDKLFKYKQLTSDYSDVIASGRCRVINRYYDIETDCDIITYRDVDTGATRSVNQFRLNLTEIKESEAV